MSVSPSDDPTPPSTRADDGSIGEVVEYIKAYADQQQVGPPTAAARGRG